MDNQSETSTLLVLSQKLVDSIGNKDWDTYYSLCDKNLSCIEPETHNNIYEGMDFHKTFFDVEDSNIKVKESICQPIVKVCGNMAMVTYKRVRQITNISNKSVEMISFAETRVWQKQENNEWKSIHFHKS